MSFDRKWRVYGSDGWLVRREPRSGASINTDRDTAHAAYDQAYACARGSYQRDVVSGAESLSGASLRGRAKEWSSRYALSRATLLTRMDDAEVMYDEAETTHGKRELVYGTAAVAVVEMAKPLKDTPVWRRAGRLAYALSEAELAERITPEHAMCVATVAVAALERLVLWAVLCREGGNR